MFRVSVVVAGISHDVGAISGDPGGQDSRELVAAMVKDWARSYAQPIDDENED